MTSHFKGFVAVSASILAMSLASGAWAATFSVAGSSNPFLAGQASGSCCVGDSAPGQSPVFAGNVVAGGPVTFTNTSGGVSNIGGTPTDGPGGNLGSLVNTPDWEGGQSVINGIAGYTNAPLDSLVGVFLSGQSPLTTPATAMLDFSSPTTTPGLQQIFYIGDVGSGFTVTAPTGAARLYLGTVDGFGWNNNTGSILVTVSEAVPEPSAWAMMLLGLGGLGLVLRASRRKPAPAVAAV